MACAYCVESQPVLDIQQLHIGDHIEFGRCSWIKLLLNLTNRRIHVQKHMRFGYMFFHHAIVTEIDHVRRNIKLVEFTKDDTSLSSFYRSFAKPTIRESHIKFDDRYDHMYRVIHKNLGKFPPNPQEIVKNARYMVEVASQEEYNVLLNNCEHLVNLCITRKCVSIQVESVIERSIYSLLSNPPKWLRTIVRVLSTWLLEFLIKFEKKLHSKDFESLVSAFSFMKHYLFRWLGCTFAIAIIFMAKDVFQFYNAWRNDNLCSHCFQKWVLKSCCRLLSMLPSPMCVFIFTIGMGFTGFLTYKALFESRKNYTKLQTLNSVKSGDVITFNLYMPFSFHDAIVVRCVKRFSAGNMKPLTNSVTSMSETEVDELISSMLNDFYRDTTNEEYRSFKYLRIFVKDATGSDSHPERDVLNENSRTRILERRSPSGWKRADFAEGATENIPQVLFAVDDEFIKLYHDFDGKYDVEIVHYELQRGFRFPDVLFGSARVIKFETKTLRPRTKHVVYKKDYSNISPAFRYPPEIVVQKALARIGERKWNFFTTWSSDLTNECVLVDPKTYYSRGYRFARIIHAQCFELLYNEATNISGRGMVEYILCSFFRSPF